MNNKEQVVELFNKQKWPVVKKKKEYREFTSKTLLDLGVQKGSEFYNLYTEFFLHNLKARSGASVVTDPYPDGFSGVFFAHKNWGIPKNYILFTTGEGEGGYFYNVDDNSVWDCGLGEQHLLGTDQLKHWDSFYEFMVWYLTVDEDE